MPSWNTFWASTFSQQLVCLCCSPRTFNLYFPHHAEEIAQLSLHRDGRIQQCFSKRVASVGFVKKDCAFLYLNCHLETLLLCVLELASKPVWVSQSSKHAWFVYQKKCPMSSKEVTMKCLLFLSTFHLHLAGICKWVWTAFSFGLLWSNVHNEAIWEGRWKCLCIMFIFVAKGNNWRIHSIFTCLVCWRIVVYCWHDVYLNFWHDLIRRKVVTCVSVLKFCKCSQSWRRW